MTSQTLTNVAPSTPTTKSTRNKRSKTAPLLGLALLVMGAGHFTGLGTGARFTDTATSTANAFTSGIVDLKLTDANQASLDTVDASLALSNMGPGDSITRPISVSNANGTAGQSVPARYAVTSTVAAGNTGLAERLDLVVGRQPVGGGTCDATAVFGNPGVATGGAWTLIYQGDLGRAAPLSVIGNSAAGQDAATAGQISADRALGGNGGTEYLCLRVTFRNTQDSPPAAAIAGEGASAAHSYVQNDPTIVDDNAYANLSTTITFTFNAEQSSAGTAS